MALTTSTLRSTTSKHATPSALRALGLVACAALLVAVAVLSLRLGSVSISNADVWNALFHYQQDSYNQTVVRSLRLPRTLVGLGVGAALAVAGATTQATTRNPLGDPSILGINSGAAFAVVTALYFGGLTSSYEYVWFAFGGALGAFVLVYLVASGGRGGATPIKLALAGAIVASLLSSWTTALLLLDEQALDVVRFWLAGSLAGRELGVFWTVLPFLGAGVAGALLMSRQLNVLSLGDDIARSLGMHTGRIRLSAAVLVVLMAGGSVAAAGPIAFVGLAVPHIVRTVVGPDYRWILAYSLLVGPVLLLGADITGRLVVRPAELQVGVITAFCGAPFLIAIARSRRVAEL
jgi:iron complex transport system permease protein